ncbi:achaete-scute homolog 1a-like [Uloborus diversus]|uniref:achaete-scute homolog 1a-like n=1 Tax=Uloborus diversus TaxID=327109 RepID=UPI00240A20FD|nr:achaete-scute homolog 1a-like [Uloborus diversus]
MASLTILNGTESLMNGDYYLVPTTSSSHTISNTSPSNILQHSPTTTMSSTAQRIAPKLPNHRYSSSSNLPQDCADLLRCKRRIQLGQLPSASKSMGPQPAAVARRNERERNRVRLVNMGFATLRQHVPHSTKNKKMSKVDTLRSAVEYIRRLQELLGETGQGMSADENSYPTGGQSSTGSPTPSLCSEASSPYDMAHGDEEDELMDFTSWF